VKERENRYPEGIENLRGTILVKGGRIIDPSNNRDEKADILIENGRIKEIGSLEMRIPHFKPSEILDARGLLVVPGLIDMHVHLREPGREDEETIQTGTLAGAKGGFTTLCCMANTNPPLDTQGSLQFVINKSRERGYCRVLPIGAITKGLKGEELTEIGELVEAGAVAISDDGKPVRNSELMRRALEYTKMFKIPVISHCEDLDLSFGGVMNENFSSAVLGMKGIPNAAEEVMVARDIILAKLSGGRVHLAHLSTAGSVELVRRAKQDGILVTAETAPHYFTLTDEAVKGFDTNTKVNPPLRTKRDTEAIKQGLADGIIDVIASDHAPHSIVEKEVEFDAAPFGIIGLETTLGLVLTQLVEPGVLSLSEAIAKMTINPSSLLGLDLGNLRVGSPGDLTLIDLDQEWIVEVEKFATKSKNSPFGGWRMKGKAVVSIVGGKIMVDQRDFY